MLECYVVFDGIDTDEISGFACGRICDVLMMYSNNVKKNEKVLKKRVMHCIKCLDMFCENLFWIIGRVREIYVFYHDLQAFDVLCVTMFV